MIHNSARKIVILLSGVCIVLGANTFAAEFHPKEKEFVKKFIDILPDHYVSKNSYYQECKSKQYDCSLKQWIVFAEGVCQYLDEGMSREDIFENMGKFLVEEEAVALVDSAIYVLCPNNKDELGAQ